MNLVGGNVIAKEPIFLITGVPGAGKSSVARELLGRFPFGLHVPIDDLREWVVSGIAHPVPTWTDETTRQFRLARSAATQSARLYAGAGFVVAIDDVIFPHEAETFFVKPLEGYRVHKVLLRPSVEAALTRNAQRTNKSFDTSILSPFVRSIHRDMGECRYEKWGWIVVDSSDLSLESTVDEVLRRVREE